MAAEQQLLSPPMSPNSVAWDDTLSSDSGSVATDSSPPPSPNIAPVIPRSNSISSDPFSANYKADRRPPQYHKRTTSTSTAPTSIVSTPPRTPTRLTVTFQLPTPPHDSISATSTVRRIPELTRAAKEEQLWGRAFDKCFSDSVLGDVTIDLTAEGITKIPATIVDVAKLVVLGSSSTDPHSSRKLGTRTFDRSKSTPVGRTTGARGFGRSQTTSALGFGGETVGPGASPSLLGLGLFVSGPVEPPKQRGRPVKVELYLGSNEIRKLPSELFTLKGLTVLSLRNNGLTLLPPAISELTALRELNLANNRLTYLPSEILQLRLETLVVNTNPFLPPPEHPEPGKPRSRILSPLKIISDIVPLTELALRILLSPPVDPETDAFDALTSNQNAKTKKSYLEENVYLPLPSEGMPVALYNATNPSLPPLLRSRPTISYKRTSPQSGSSLIAAPEIVEWNTKDVDDALSNSMFNHCPSLSCPQKQHGDYVFVTPAETRYEWVNEVAGVSVTDLDHGVVPVLWRGCSSGCLDFLLHVDGFDDWDTLDGEE
ncbi:hypothetical protein FRC03_010018 [Tulasnella sp. 419]|nr:hypothetical protein FRC03_010018 [Tulasnella sp. 419]